MDANTASNMECFDTLTTSLKENRPPAAATCRQFGGITPRFSPAHGPPSAERRVEHTYGADAIWSGRYDEGPTLSNNALTYLRAFPLTGTSLCLSIWLSGIGAVNNVDMRLSKNIRLGGERRAEVVL